MTECPYCLDTIEDLADTTTCDSCGTAHHRECWLENGGCCVKTCEKVSRNVEIDVQAEGRDRVVLSRESVQSVRRRRPRQISNPCIKCGRQVREGQLYCDECRPKRDEGQDSRNLGPLLLMLAIVALALVWIFIITAAPDNNLLRPEQTRTETKTNR